MPNYKIAGAICKFNGKVKHGKGGLKKCKKIRDVATQGGSCLSGESDIFIFCDAARGTKNIMTQWGKWHEEAYCKEKFPKNVFLTLIFNFYRFSVV